LRDSKPMSRRLRYEPQSEPRIRHSDCNPASSILQNLEAFIQFQNNQATVVPVRSTQVQARSNELIRSLQRITCLSLEIRDGYLRLKESQKLPLLYAGLISSYQVEMAIHADRRCSSTAKDLLLGAIQSSNTYLVGENQIATFGRVASNDSIELDFRDFAKIVYRDVPRESFDIGMVFLHELAHRHLKLKDPNKNEISRDHFVRGQAVMFINRIERELGLPERLHYAPVMVTYNRYNPCWAVYFGTLPHRIELDQRFGLK
jgi:hypothetical protein